MAGWHFVCSRCARQVQPNTNRTNIQVQRIADCPFSVYIICLHICNSIKCFPTGRWRHAGIPSSWEMRWSLRRRRLFINGWRWTYVYDARLDDVFNGCVMCVPGQRAAQATQAKHICCEQSDGHGHHIGSMPLMRSFRFCQKCIYIETDLHREASKWARERGTRLWSAHCAIVRVPQNCVLVAGGPAERPRDGMAMEWE